MENQENDVPEPSETNPIPLLRAAYEGDLPIGNIVLRCAVLEDETRVLTRSSFIKAIGRTGKAQGGRAYDEEFKTPVFLSANNLKPFVSQELLDSSKPVLFTASKGSTSIGYRYELLPQVCYVFVDAAESGVLKDNQLHIAAKCKELIRGFAHVGLAALIDAATGYEKVRDRVALEKILAKYISPDVLQWQKAFHEDFYDELFRLRGWQRRPTSMQRPMLAAKLTIDVVYQRLAPGVYEVLNEKTPRNDKGRLKNKLHQRLTVEEGRVALERHLHAVTALMRASNNWDSFKRLLERSFPKHNATLMLPLDFGDENDNR